MGTTTHPAQAAVDAAVRLLATRTVEIEFEQGGNPSRFDREAPHIEVLTVGRIHIRRNASRGALVVRSDGHRVLEVQGATVQHYEPGAWVAKLLAMAGQEAAA